MRHGKARQFYQIKSAFRKQQPLSRCKTYFSENLHFSNKNVFYQCDIMVTF